MIMALESREDHVWKTGILIEQLKDLCVTVLFIFCLDPLRLFRRTCFCASFALNWLILMIMQSKWVEDRVCEAYAQLLCSGTGKCWVCDTSISYASSMIL